MLLLIILAPISATIIQMSLSRTREFAADEGAAKLTGNSQGLAKALARLDNQNGHLSVEEMPAFSALLIINPLSSNFVNNLFSTHPPTNSRIENLKQLNNPKYQASIMKSRKYDQKKNTIISLAIILAAFGLTYAPLPGLNKTVIVVSGTELKEPLQEIEKKFEQANKNINIELKFQGSQDIINNFIDQKNDFNPTILIPENSELVKQLESRLNAQGDSEPFYNNPQPISKTILVGIAWPERGKLLFPNGRFQWQNIENAMNKRNWGAIGGKTEWGSFDFVTTDPTRSNSGQITLNLWSKSKLGLKRVTINNLNNPQINNLFSLIKKSVYQPPRSTDILLQEFITRGRNDADVATVYESIAIYRWSQSSDNQGNSYQIYYLNPTIETVATAAIVKRNIGAGEAKAAQQFLDFILAIEQQKILAKYGFRPVINGINLNSISNSPWVENIPGIETNPNLNIIPPPNPELIDEIQKIWTRAK